MRDFRFTRRSLLGSAGATLLGPLAGTARADASDMTVGHGVPVALPAFEVRIRLEPLLWTVGTGYGTGLRVIRSGRVLGPLLAGSVQSGYVRWQTDTSRGAVDLQLQAVVLRDDGTVVEVRDRSVHAIAATRGDLSRLASATSLHVANDQDGVPVLFVGRLDASLLESGSLRLNAFRVG